VTSIYRSQFAALAAASSLALATGVSAETAPAQGASSDEALTEVVVTGSRVIKNGNDSPTPVTVISPQEMAAVHPGTIADQLNDLPQFSGSRGQYTNPGGGNVSTSPAAANTSANVVNLRNMGFTRTLVLMDGHRVAPTSPDGTIDVNMIPQMLLQRVDIVTGGASAVYGSDAVTGVVNFVTDTKFNGVKVNAQTGVSNYGDDRTIDVGTAWGTSLFDGRGHIEASYQYRDDPGIPHRSLRPCCKYQPTVENLTGQAVGPYQLFYNVRSSNTSFGGYIAPQNNSAINNAGTFVNPLAGMNFTANGMLVPFVNGVYAGPTTTTKSPNGLVTVTLPPSNEAGGDGAYGDSTLKGKLRMHQLFTRLDYDFTDSVHGYADVAGTYNYNWSQFSYGTLSTPNGGNSVTISATDPYLALQYQTQLANAGISTFKLSKTLLDAPATNVSSWERQYSINGGLDVKFGDGYEWDSQYTHGRNMQNSRQNANINTLKLAAALNTTTSNGQIVCAVSVTTNAGLYPGCVPLNPFGPTAESQDAINYIEGVTELRAFTNMDDVTSSVTGAPFSTWAGPVNMALSAEWRRLSYTLEPSAVPNDLNNEVNCAGLLAANCSATPTAQVWASGTSAWRSLVDVSVSEAAFEFDAPLLKDAPLAKDVSLNGGARWTDYTTSGAAWTWKIGLDWQLNDSLTLRGTRSRDIRAPTLNDLYLPATTATSGGFDNLTSANLGNAPIPFITHGNPNLVPEVGNTVTAGFVYRPAWLPGFSVAIDSFFINVTNALTQIQGNSTTAQLGCANSGGASVLCQLIVRPIDCCTASPANTATLFYAESLNIATQWTQGADLEANWSTRIHEHPLSLRAFATFQPHIGYQIPGTAPYDMGGVAFNNGAIQASPVWRASFLARYSPVTNFTVDLMERWRSSLAWGPQQSPPYQFQMPPIASFATTDLNLSYLFKYENGGQTEVFFNVINLLDKTPPAAAFFNNNAPGVAQGFAIGDDPQGRYYTVGFRFRM
jgi:outer membrane receptor protein involved in Fe transport